MKVCYVFSIEWPHQGDSNEYTQYSISQYEQEMLQYVTNAPAGPSHLEGDHR